ncbi:MAG: DNA polymerase III subunit gamma/tau [Bacteroidia bacterium]|nr:DNA polymerase III subunit gamma/tau [Bacteroidia bacterium]
MNDFVVSARKYRPGKFVDVVGQESITTTLKNAIKTSHLAQAFLFCGPRGVGKTTCARILAKTVNCENITADYEACNNCDSCNSFNQSQSFNVHELDAASNNSVDDIRNLVEQVRYAPHKGQFKIYIIDEVHMLSQAAFNAFLKTLEEPPAHAIFILATTEKFKIIPTILSRCQIFDFSRITVSDITKHLMYIAEQEKVEAEEDGLHIIAQKADGALRDALSMFDQIVSFSGNKVTLKDVTTNLHVLDYDYYFGITEDVFTSQISDALQTFNTILAEGFDGHQFINGLSSHFRDLLVSKDAATLNLLEVSDKIKSRYQQQSQKFSIAQLFQMLEVCNQCDVGFRLAKNKRLHVEFALIKLCSLFGEAASTPARQIQTAEKKTPSVNPSKPVLQKSESKPVEAAPVPVQAVVNEPKQTKPVEVVAKPAAKPKPVEPKISNPVSRTVSISQRLNKTGEVKKKDSEEIDPYAGYPETDFNEEQLKLVIDAFANVQFETGRKNLHTSLTTHPAKLNEKFAVEVMVNNKVQVQELNDVKTDLLGFMKEKLNNGAIKLNISVAPIEKVEHRAYTDTDKFKKMAEKNPSLHTFRKTFDLDFD